MPDPEDDEEPEGDGKEPTRDEQEPEGDEKEPARDEQEPEGDGKESPAEEDVPLSDLREDIAGLRGDERAPGEDRDNVEASPATNRSATSGDSDLESEIVQGSDEGQEKIPLSELKDDLSDREDTGEERLFYREAVDDVESEAVWADLLMGEGDTTKSFEPTAIEEIEGRDFQVVPTTLCHRCEFFGDPPKLHCTHEGTTIHETVDMDHYRVSDCPMVKTEEGPDREPEPSPQSLEDE